MQIMEGNIKLLMPLFTSLQTSDNMNTNIIIFVPENMKRSIIFRA